MLSETEKWEEKQKDGILQQINDRLEDEDWGAGCDRFVIKVVLEGRFNLTDILVQKKPPIRKIF